MDPHFGLRCPWISGRPWETQELFEWIKSMVRDQVNGLAGNLFGS